jgi:hypothetical protein
MVTEKNFRDFLDNAMWLLTVDTVHAYQRVLTISAQARHDLGSGWWDASLDTLEKEANTRLNKLVRVSENDG